MAINILLFGQLADITASRNVVLEDVRDTDTLKQQLQTLYPALSTVKYAIAVDKKMINENTILSSNKEVALLPPFSGG